MFLYMLIFMAYHSSRWIPRNQRIKFQIVNAVFAALVLLPQFYVMASPKSSRYCRQPLLSNLSASIALSFIATGEPMHIRHISERFTMWWKKKTPNSSAQCTPPCTVCNIQAKKEDTELTLTPSIGFSVVFTLIDSVPQSLWASYHVFGILTCGQGLCTAILTLTAAACVRNRLNIIIKFCRETTASKLCIYIFTFTG
ncbi:uncharacterized protein [Pseudochaenichthys georgianus]|uniref:uncharacterized protein n=1 Tax=Pseudochaenichthys georgianus TaxID=52239 RepID=UPI001469CB83|nr:uncharacterized protein LOC117446161 [Pseudochaenichthys georgianus]